MSIESESLSLFSSNISATVDLALVMLNKFTIALCAIAVLSIQQVRCVPEVRAESGGNMTLSVAEGNDIFVEQKSSDAITLRTSILTLLNRVVALETQIAQVLLYK